MCVIRRCTVAGSYKTPLPYTMRQRWKKQSWTGSGVRTIPTHLAIPRHLYLVDNHHYYLNSYWFHWCCTYLVVSPHEKHHPCDRWIIPLPTILDEMISHTQVVIFDDWSPFPGPHGIPRLNDWDFTASHNCMRLIIHTHALPAQHRHILQLLRIVLVLNTSYWHR